LFLEVRGFVFAFGGGVFGVGFDFVGVASRLLLLLLLVVY
jgi:hypothetical protein